MKQNSKSSGRRLILSLEKKRHEKKEFYKLSELSDRWDKSQQTLRRWIKEGKLHATKFVGSYGVSIDEINRIEKGGK